MPGRAGVDATKPEVTLMDFRRRLKSLLSGESSLSVARHLQFSCNHALDLPPSPYLVRIIDLHISPSIDASPSPHLVSFSSFCCMARSPPSPKIYSMSTL